MTQLYVACVEWGNYLGRGREYVAKLRAAVARNLRRPHHFAILTDDFDRHPQDPAARDIHLRMELPGGLVGWWNKLALFKPGMFPAGARILFLDLDVVITGDLEALVAQPGIVHLLDWGWEINAYCSSTMVWDAGEHAEIWTSSRPRTFQKFVGDQDWISFLGGWQRLPSQLCRSYRYHAWAGQIPDDCRVVAFHGKPKPHELQPGRLASLWNGYVWHESV